LSDLVLFLYNYIKVAVSGKITKIIEIDFNDMIEEIVSTLKGKSVLVIIRTYYADNSMFSGEEKLEKFRNFVKELTLNGEVKVLLMGPLEISQIDGIS
jgi:hypothetical protein